MGVENDCFEYCPLCSGDLDTGWECIKCGKDWMAMAMQHSASAVVPMDVEGQLFWLTKAIVASSAFYKAAPGSPPDDSSATVQP